MNIVFASLLLTLGAGNSAKAIIRIDQKEYAAAFFSFAVSLMSMRIALLMLQGKF